MRLHFKQQLILGIVPIPEVILDFKSRHSLVPLLRGLQHAFETPALNEQIFRILADKVLSDKQKTGRYGMSLWEIVVLGVVKLNGSLDYDALHNLCNNHHSLRGLLGVQRNDFTIGKTYSLQSIKDNVMLLDESTIEQIVEVIALGGQDIVKKKEAKVSLDLAVKVDSFVVESKIHFPTDLNLLWDSLRKSLETIGYFQSQGKRLTGWREWQSYQKKGHSLYRSASEIHRKKGQGYKERLAEAVEGYLEFARTVAKKVRSALAQLVANQLISKSINTVHEQRVKDLTYYLEMTDKHIDLVHRRIILGETIPHKEKVFSIFEPHVEWNSKGKPNCPVELGHNVLVATDQYGFILHHRVHEKMVDKQMTIIVGKKIAEKYGESNELESISFDKNYHSKPAAEYLTTRFKVVVLPKAGRKSKLQLANEENADYQVAKLGHSKIEGNINELEHHGLDQCRDRGIEGFKRYVAYGVLSYNLTKLGRLLIEQERQDQRAKQRTAA